LQHGDVVGPSSGRAKVIDRPAAITPLKVKWPGSDHGGTIFFTVRTTKFTIGPLGKPSRSPIEATTTCLTDVPASACCERDAKFSSTITASAPES
jgi:hypothetical protein